ncbi:unnamed protein product [Adineta ricciae]|uniref:Uncharacterized protein n=1 Tax=Adineta ricciae TaxID=249248 RepID=A0A816EGQ4_ADIRI|nr:unnamed protein product [Adineta ricciae]CAF1647346.1 unnamed protein product [Adineta ricciae]
MVSTMMSVIGLLVFMTVCSRLDAASIKDRCPLPSNLKNNYDYDWKSKSHEWQNTKAMPTFLQLVLSWTQTFCESLPQYAQNTEFQCRNRKHFGLVVHGLWPQASKANSVRAHPRNCRNEKQLNATLVKRYYCMMPDEDLIQSQWEKHGTCYFKTATEYYQTIENLYGSLNIPDIASMKNVTAANIKSTFLTLNPTLFASAIQVSMDYENRLKEIKICYDLKQKFVRCSL